eukprot:2964061-Amphidinium_carterae.1
MNEVHPLARGRMHISLSLSLQGTMINAVAAVAQREIRPTWAIASGSSGTTAMVLSGACTGDPTAKNNTPHMVKLQDSGEPKTTP